MVSSSRKRAFALALVFACASSAHAAVTGFCDYFTLTTACLAITSSAACTGDCAWSAADSECQLDSSAALVVLTATDPTSRAYATQVYACLADENDGTSCAADTNCEYDASSGECSVTGTFTVSTYATCSASTSAGERTRVGFVAPATAFVAATALVALA
eukprot:CAMPEP_0179708312 /NCGR_PEP_ID=MMETSP0937-20121108/5307_1 /TAXON_ID=548131 ORGANISM="Ostreococcus mediterraneus, Strain clade-D-RCC2593" /NCGR_SAMPLE_ID=MMETSP0937 /ASSEMBLY_ACC=CAM_ASM_000575 /LENGTH=159 /DNA_ID=CAMNT_0021581631 /DNA_START=192 /DNA_END=671 /DNA_ORIENTATION=+